ncbi:Uncharacterized protein dnm_061650 [Desulfonema magnum]|uniref:Uncharacterized protein n=1 Tax=Desulfonema magnum TaxID=45655 RepID=A0A975GQQ2_9BACT|nr:Uncharacterized protein dnm_061630 [Desulfonema magnum]QTA90104.1 Uncharacterized protein dnm_061650 [Desulfonema magnum]
MNQETRLFPPGPEVSLKKKPGFFSGPNCEPRFYESRNPAFSPDSEVSLKKKAGFLLRPEL